MEFYLVQSCSRSTMKIIARTNISTPARCALFTLKKGGLAFNFSPPGIMENEENCLVCDCPEFNVLAYLKKDWRYDYYSLYGHPLPNDNYTCVPKVGLFEINQEPLNFREALIDCRKKDSELAHVISQIRTSTLATLVKQIGKHGTAKKAYISLQDIKQEGVFKTTIGEPLSCFDYRAWGPSEPRDRLKDEDCAVLDDRKQWRISRCSQRLPYICELWPGGDSLNDITTGLVHCSELKEDEIERCIERDRSTPTTEDNKFERCWYGVTFNLNPRKARRLPPLFGWKTFRQKKTNKSKDPSQSSENSTKTPESSSLQYDYFKIP